jgi:hypothetical protein
MRANIAPVLYTDALKYETAGEQQSLHRLP